MKRLLLRLHALAIFSLFFACFSLSPLVPVQAWLQQDAHISGTASDPSAPMNYWNDCGIRNWDGVWAEAGDIVSTTKWNQFVCRIGNVAFRPLFDWARGNWTGFNGGYTNFLWRKSNVIAGKAGGFVGAINLGITQEGEGQIRIHEAEFPYEFASPTAANPAGGHVRLGTIRYHMTTGGDIPTDRLDLNGFRNGLWIGMQTDPDSTVTGTEFSDGVPPVASGGVPTGYVVGWEKINMYDTAAFDMNCSYRLALDNGDPRTWYMEATRPNQLRTNSTKDWISLYATNKTQLVWDSAMNGHMAGPVPGQQITKIEKLCMWPTSRTPPPKLTYTQSATTPDGTYSLPASTTSTIRYAVPSGKGLNVTHSWSSSDATGVVVKYRYAYGTCTEMSPTTYTQVAAGAPSGSQTSSISAAQVDRWRGCTYAFLVQANGGANGPYVATFDQAWQ